MKTSIQSRRRTGKLRAALLVAAMSGLLASGTAAAVGWTVVDPTHIKTQIAEFGKEAARWGEQGRQWYKEYQQFMQQYESFLSTIDNMQSMFGLPQQGFEMKTVDENTFDVEERCGSKYGSGVTGVLGQLTQINMQHDVYQQRWLLCARLQVTLNKRYNDAVRYLQETMPEMQQELNNAGEQFRGSGKTAGDMNAYAAKLNKVNGDIARSTKDFEARMQAYDAYAKATERSQGTLTRASMRGGNAGLIRKITSTAVMYQQLCGNGQCD